jgi:hypothetical protein
LPASFSSVWLMPLLFGAFLITRLIPTLLITSKLSLRPPLPQVFVRRLHYARYTSPAYLSIA